MYTARRRKDAPAMWYARGAARLYINCAPLECQRGWDDDDDTVLSRGADRLRKYIRIYIYVSVIRMQNFELGESLDIRACVTQIARFA